MKNIGYRCSSRKEDPQERLGRLAARQWGAWQRMHPRVYRMRGAPVSWQQRLMAAQLWAGEGAAISHRAAAALWELDGFEPGIVELTVLGRRSPVPAGIIPHHTRELGRSDAGLLGPLRVTGIVRTLMDLGAVVEDPALVEAALESALRRDPEVLDRLIDRLDAVGGRGRRGAGVAREILAVRDPGSAPTESMFETLLDRLLRGAGLPIPVRQHEVKQGDLVLARLDFAWPELRVGLEAEGLRWHAGRQAFQRDVDRANDLALTRWTVIRVTWDDLVRGTDRVVVKLRQALGLT